jgi:hypothetical protein
MMTNAPAIVPAPTWPVDDDHTVETRPNRATAILHRVVTPRGSTCPAATWHPDRLLLITILGATDNIEAPFGIARRYPAIEARA